MRKNKSILFRLSEEEFEILKKKTKDFKFRTISEYCRFVALNAKRIDIIVGDSLVQFISGEK